MIKVTHRGATSTVTGSNGVYKVCKHTTKRGKWQIFRVEANRKKLVATTDWHGRDGAVYYAYNLASNY